MNQAGRLANLDEVYGNLYGIARWSIDAILEQGQLPVKEIHPANYHKIQKLYPDSCAVLVLQDGGDNCRVEASGVRAAEDAAFYNSISLDGFDVILHSSKSAGRDTFIEDSHIAIQAYLGGRDRFPHPAHIDKLNGEGYEKVAEHFTEHERPTTRDFHRLSEGFFRDTISTLAVDSSCLEIGPGQGWLRKRFRWPNVRYETQELSSSMAAVGGAETERIAKGIGSARAMPFSSSRFDYVLASLGDGYCYPAALAEIRRVLKSDGLFYFTAPSGVWAQGLRFPEDRDKTRFSLPNDETAEVYSFAFTLEELADLFKQCGFRIAHAMEFCGDRLGDGWEASVAVRESSRKLGRELPSLPIINAIVALQDR